MLKKKKKGRFPFPFLHTLTKANCKTLVFFSSWLAAVPEMSGQPQPCSEPASDNGGHWKWGKLHSGFNSSAEPASSPLRHREGGGGRLWGLKHCTASQSTSERVTPALTLSFTHPSSLVFSDFCFFFLPTERTLSG